jgi:inner membrane protein
MRTSPMLRLAIMGAMLIGLMFPLLTMFAVVSERASRRNDAVREVGGEWGNPQTFGGPVLTVPYRYNWKDQDGTSRERIERVFLLPEHLAIEGTVEPETRYRGLFPVIVYTATLKVSGRFARPDFSWVRPSPSSIDWENATIDIGISDPRGIGRSMTLTVGGRQAPVVPGVTSNGLFTTGVRAAAQVIPAELTSIPFAFDIDLKGTRDLRFLPLGDETVVRLSSPWPHPGFSGAPQEREVSDSGFTAAWRVPYFGRGYATRWTQETMRTEERQAQAAASAFGVGLLQPVDIYQQAERAVKYAPLFIVLTFVIAFLWEVTGKALVHPIQYLFVGFAMCLFYLLLLALSEHVGFDRAYAAATFATVTLLSWYWTWVLLGARQGAVMCTALVALYGFLYLLLRLEDYALLAGSLGLFSMLALVMVLTRRVDWYTLRLTEPSGK